MKGGLTWRIGRWAQMQCESYCPTPTCMLGNIYNVDLPRTMPLPDSVADAGTPMQQNIGDHEGRNFRRMRAASRCDKHNYLFTTGK